MAASTKVGELILTIDKQPDPRVLVMDFDKSSSFTVQRFSTTVGTSTTKVDVDGSGEFSENSLTYREKTYLDSGIGVLVWTETFTLKR